MTTTPTPAAAPDPCPKPARRRAARPAPPAPSDSPPSAPAPPEAAPRWPHVPMRWPEQEHFSEPWMVPWLEAAANSLSVTEACQQAGIGLSQYLLGRRRDLAFDRAALIFDQIVDLMIQEATRRKALDGDPQATKIYFTYIRRPAFAAAFASHARVPKPPRDEPVPPHVAEAMLCAGLEALRNGPPPEDPDETAVPPWHLPAAPARP